ncbi:MAG: hypothetical protein ACM3KH_00165, partial [Thiobacillus sp.]
INNDDVIKAIYKKLDQRDNYPENCILIVNAFGNEIYIDRKVIHDAIKDLTKEFTDVYLVIYNLPLLTMAHVSYISKPDCPGLAIQLQRFEYLDKWDFNFDGRIML